MYSSSWKPRPRRLALVVDSDPGVRSFIRNLLSWNHFTTLEAGSRDEALAQCQQHPGGIDLIVADANVAGLDAGELPGLIAEAQPNTRVLFTDHTDESPALEGREEICLQKPLSPMTLLQGIQETLDPRPDRIRRTPRLRRDYATSATMVLHN
jgi:CheY-like chemotaxis protein